MELLIAVSISAVIIISISNIDTFSRFQVASSDRRARLQNDASYVLEHMAKYLTGTAAQGGAIGNVISPAVSYTPIGGDNAITIQIDDNENGKWDGEPTDKHIAYRYNAATYRISYYPPYTGFPPGVTPTVLTSTVRGNFSSDIAQPTYCYYIPANNYIEVQIGACWSPSVTCGTPGNPALTIKNRIYMPAVSTH